MRGSTVSIVVLLALGLLCVPLPAAEAQQPLAKIPQVGVVWPGSPPTGAAPSFEAFRHELHERGYVEGQNIAFVWRSTEGNAEQLSDLVAELVRVPVDILVALGAPAAQATKLRGYPETLPTCHSDIKQHAGGNETQGARKGKAYTA